MLDPRLQLTSAFLSLSLLMGSCNIECTQKCDRLTSKMHHMDFYRTGEVLTASSVRKVAEGTPNQHRPFTVPTDSRSKGNPIFTSAQLGGLFYYNLFSCLSWILRRKEADE